MMKIKIWQRNFAIQGFPTIKFLPNGLNVTEGSVEHNGGRTESDLLDFINKCSN